MQPLAIIVTKPEIATSTLRTCVNELLYSLSIDAQRNKQIEQLMIERDLEVATAYDFNYGTAMMDPLDRWYTSDVFYIASEIISLKERYSKRIRRCQVRHERFKSIVEELPQGDAEVFLRAFSTDLEVDEQDVKLIIRKHLKLIKSFYPEE